MTSRGQAKSSRKHLLHQASARQRSRNNRGILIIRIIEVETITASRGLKVKEKRGGRRTTVREKRKRRGGRGRGRGGRKRSYHQVSGRRGEGEARETIFTEYPRGSSRGPVLCQDYSRMSRRLRGSTTILSLILLQACWTLYAARIVSIAKERTVSTLYLRSHPLPILLHHLVRFSGHRELFVSLSLSLVSSRLFASCSSTITERFSLFSQRRRRRRAVVPGR